MTAKEPHAETYENAAKVDTELTAILPSLPTGVSAAYQWQKQVYANEAYSYQTVHDGASFTPDEWAATG